MSYKIYHYKKLASTNDKAREFIKNNKCEIVVLAETQTKGRGRFGRKWHSSKDGLWFSITLKIIRAKNLQYLTFIAALAVVKSIRKIFGINAKIKWPNDIIYNKKKLCGILTEGVFGNDNYAVVGIGLNVNQTKFPDYIKDTAISLKLVHLENYIRKKIDKKILLKKILDEFEMLYILYQNQKYKKIISEWKRYSNMLGNKIRVKTADKEYFGKAVGVDEDCNLLIKLKNGYIKKIIEGDVLFQ